MMYWVFRGIFVALMIAVTTVLSGSQEAEQYSIYVLGVAVGLSLLIIGIDVFTPRKSLAALVGTFFGLFAGMLMAIALIVVIEMLARTMVPELWQDAVDFAAPTNAVRRLVSSIEFLVIVICIYLAVTFVMQTKDDIRVVIPYVEFAKQTRGNRPLILDTSVIIDGRIADICDTRIIDSALIIPRFVLQELQAIADSSDKLKRNRGRRGLDMLNKLQTNDKVEIKISDTRLPSVEEAGDVDQKLLALAKKVDGRVVTNDYNLNKIAQLRGVDVIKINDLANAMKPVVMPGEAMTVRIIKPGEEPGQGIGYLEDGTMIVAENSREKVNEEVSITVTSVLQTSAGRMIFGRPEGLPAVPRRRPR